MPTLLEKPSEASRSALPTRVLHSRHHWERWRGILIAMIVGLTATNIALWVFHPSWRTPENGKILALVWAVGILLTTLAAIISWCFAPASLSDTAEGIDRSLASKNRFETAATLHDSTSPLAIAQRAETENYLRSAPHVRPVKALPWLVGGVIALVLVHFLMLFMWGVPALLHPKPSAPPPPKTLPQASIIWKSPEPESKANPVEEVPTVAVAQSTTGLKNLTLEISINGVPKKSVPLPAKPYDQAGKNTIKQSLYMDDLGAQPFDMVSYFIRGQRITDLKVPETTSAIQFIQVRPFRDDVAITSHPPGTGDEEAYLLELKLAQLRAVKENFILSHTDLPVTDPNWIKENNRVGKNQGDLSAKTEEVVQYFITQGAPPEVIDLLRQAEAPMDDASKKILATKNNEALPPQQKALSLITEVEKFFHKGVNLKSKPAQEKPKPNDPFKDKQKHEIKQRIQGVAGQLELLAKNQTNLASDLNSPNSSSPSSGSPSQSDDSKPQGNDKPAAPSNPSPSGNPAPGTQPSNPSGSKPDADTGQNGVAAETDPQAVDPFSPNADKGTFTERQARILQGIGTLLNTNAVFPAPVKGAMEDAQKDAGHAIHQLDQADPNSAREPATSAAQDLQRAVAEMNKAGEEQTKAVMEEAQQKLNDLSQQLQALAKNGSPDAQQKLADAAGQLHDLQQHLHDAADQQQETGSSAAAQRLEHLANGIADQKVENDLHDMAQKGVDANKTLSDAQKLEALAAEAAKGQVPGAPSAKDVAELVNALEKSRANLARLAGQAGAPGAEKPTGTNPSGQNPPGAPPGQQQAQGNQPGQEHGQGQNQQQPQGQGQQQAQNQGQSQGQQAQNQGQGQSPQQAQGQGQGHDQGQQEAQGQGQGQSQQEAQGQGQGEGQGQGNNQQQAQGPSQQQGPGEGQGQGNQMADQSPANSDPNAQGGSGNNGINGMGQAPPNSPTHQGMGDAYHEMLADLKDEVQRATVTLPMVPAAEVAKQVAAAQGQEADKVKEINVVAAYQAITPPLDTLISELKKLEDHTQRSDVVKQPDLDEAPPLYRPAVSDYFETVSRDYKPANDNSDTDTKNP